MTPRPPERASWLDRPGPVLPRRGVVEGFYGAPWTHEERLDLLDFASSVGLNEYVLAPKDDPYQRERWRDPVPASDLRRFTDLAAAAERNGVRFVTAVSPGLSMRVADPEEHRRLAAKAQQLLDAGADEVLLLFDDVPTTLLDPADVALYGEGPEGLGRAHGDVCRRFRDEVLLPSGRSPVVTMCPTDYRGCDATPYREGLAETLPADAVVLWTGADIVVGEITRADIDAAARSYDRALMLWDNFPVNDFDRSRAFLGPLLGRTGEISGSAVVGVLANPMVEAAPSRFGLASCAEWAWDPAAYDAAASGAEALRLVAGPAASMLEPLVSACSSWPPSAPRCPPLERLTEAALDGDGDALVRLATAGRTLATAGLGAVPDGADPALLEGLAPWSAACRSIGAALVEACALLDDLDRGRGSARSVAAQAALDTALSGSADVLRPVVEPFARAVLGRAAEDG